MAETHQRAWAGVDVGKARHHVEVVDAEGRTLVRRGIDNDQAAIESMIGESAAAAEQVVWAVDVTSSSGALLLGLLIAAGQRVVYVPGRARSTAWPGRFVGRPRPTRKTRG